MYDERQAKMEAGVRAVNRLNTDKQIRPGMAFPDLIRSCMQYANMCQLRDQLYAQLEGCNKELEAVGGALSLQMNEGLWDMRALEIARTYQQAMDEMSTPNTSYGGGAISGVARGLGG